MSNYTLPKTRKKPTDVATDYDTDYNTQDGITHVDDRDEDTSQYTHKGEQLTLSCQTDIDLAGQQDTRQSTSAYILYLNGTLFHWRAHTEKLIIKSTASGEYIALSRGNQACKHVREILKFMGNTQHIYHLYTDNQAAEHLATQPNMTDNSRSIDIRHHEIKQDYMHADMRIVGVSSKDNTSDILTKSLQPPIHAKHCSHLHILAPTVTQNATFITKKTTPHNKKPQQEPKHIIRNTDDPYHIHTHVSPIDTSTPSNRTTKRRRQKQRQRYWDKIIEQRTHSHRRPHTILPQGIHTILNQDVKLHAHHSSHPIHTTSNTQITHPTYQHAPKKGK
jgi:hypothetical protein